MSEFVCSYRLRGWSVAFSVFMLSLFAGGMAFLAYSESDRFFGIEVGYPYGMLIYGACALGTLVVAVILFLRSIHQRSAEPVITVGGDQMTLPKSLVSPQTITIRYEDIELIEIEKAERTAMSFIRIRHKGGNTRISDMGFESQDDFMAVYKQLDQKLSRKDEIA